MCECDVGRVGWCMWRVLNRGRGVEGGDVNVMMCVGLMLVDGRVIGGGYAVVLRM